LNPTPGVRGVFFFLCSQLVRVSSKNINPKGSAKHEALLNTKRTGIRQVERKAGCQVRIPLVLSPKRKPCITPPPHPLIFLPRRACTGVDNPLWQFLLILREGLDTTPHTGVYSGGLGHIPSHRGVLKRSEGLGYNLSHRGVLERAWIQPLTQGCTREVRRACIQPLTQGCTQEVRRAWIQPLTQGCT
jgi:hypothetical protein